MDGTIYFAQGSGGGRIKIGFTRTGVERRFSVLQTGCSDKLRLLRAIEGTPQQERTLHRMFRSARATGEWFEATQELLDFIREPQEIREPERDGASSGRGTTNKVQYVLTAGQIQALRLEALRRVAADGSYRRPDASEVLREILDAWMAKGKR